MKVRALLRHSGAGRRPEPGIHNHRSRVMDSGLAAIARRRRASTRLWRRPGMTEHEVGGQA
jgi:hypothetical protein